MRGVRWFPFPDPGFGGCGLLMRRLGGLGWNREVDDGLRHFLGLCGYGGFVG